ncbi:hypothetical protein OUZ56_023225 [Daphnia magna]|uniref:Uncharacterized protein n=1 Tax=Daphnia magna TaxID=35525 RepID=A0ABR0AYM4_9CRUS|nr:hypothetical protein OUZ56_023225 [Daphnia magna]
MLCLLEMLNDVTVFPNSILGKTLDVKRNFIMPECPFFRSKSQVSKGNLVHNSNSTTLNSDFQIPARENEGKTSLHENILQIELLEWPNNGPDDRLNIAVYKVSPGSGID